MVKIFIFKRGVLHSEVSIRTSAVFEEKRNAVLGNEKATVFSSFVFVASPSDIAIDKRNTRMKVNYNYELRTYIHYKQMYGCCGSTWPLI